MLSQEMPAYLALACAKGVSFEADSMAVLPDLAAKNLLHWAGAVKMVLLVHSSSLRLLSEFSPYSEPSFQISSRLHSR